MNGTALYLYQLDPATAETQAERFTRVLDTLVVLCCLKRWALW